MALDNATKWLLLVISLPTQSATPRMRVWRALKGAGAAVLRDGVYLLPDQPATQASFRDQAHEVEEAGGTAYLVPFVSPTDDAREYVQLFDRTELYAELLVRITELKEQLVTLEEPEARKRLIPLRRDVTTLISIDYFPGPARNQVSEALAELEVSVTAMFSPGEPHAVAREIRRLRLEDYRGRTWATRARPWVDRLASAWFIRRFVDPEARFLWLQDPKDCPSEALGFDFDGATFTHIGAQVTFEVLVASFGLTEDRGLTRLNQLVHYLDVGGIPVMEAPGVETVLAGMRQRLMNDDALLAEAGGTFDALYAAYTHNLPTPSVIDDAEQNYVN